MNRRECHMVAVLLIVVGVGLDAMWVQLTNERPLPLKTICGAMICFGAAVLGASVRVK